MQSSQSIVDALRFNSMKCIDGMLPAGIERRSSNAYLSEVASSKGRRSNANGRRAFRKINLGFRPSVLGSGSPQKKVSRDGEHTKNTGKTEASKTPSSKADFVEETDVDTVPSSETDPIKVADVHIASDPLAIMSDSLAAIQVSWSLKMPSGLSDPDRKKISEASMARYREFAPADATERLLASLSVSLQSAAMTSLQYAAGTKSLPARTEELNNAIKAARAAAELLGQLGLRRGRGKQTVAVGQVTVETGGQAIVGNVNSEGRRSTKLEETENPNDDPSRG